MDPVHWTADRGNRYRLGYEERKPQLRNLGLIRRPPLGASHRTGPRGCTACSGLPSGGGACPKPGTFCRLWPRFPACSNRDRAVLGHAPADLPHNERGGRSVEHRRRLVRCVATPPEACPGAGSGPGRGLSRREIGAIVPRQLAWCPASGRLHRLMEARSIAVRPRGPCDGWRRGGRRLNPDSAVAASVPRNRVYSFFTSIRCPMDGVHLSFTGKPVNWSGWSDLN